MTALSTGARSGDLAPGTAFAAAPPSTPVPPEDGSAPKLRSAESSELQAYTKPEAAISKADRLRLVLVMAAFQRSIRRASDGPRS